MVIKNTLFSLPVSYPNECRLAWRIEKLQRDLRWGGVGDEFNYHFVGWRRVCEPIQNGGLGIYDLVLFN